MHWRAALADLGVTVPADDSPPLMLACPLCQSDTLLLRDDPFDGGHWLHCSSCRFSGDVVELSAAARQQTVEVAALRLSHQGLLPGLTEELLRQYLKAVATRQDIVTKWQQTSHAVYHTNRLRSILSSLYLPCMAESDRWLENVSKIIGFSSASDEHDPEREAILLPFYDLPGRPRRLAKVVRTETGEFVLDFPRDLAGRGTEGGLCLPADMATAAAPFGNTVFLVSDPQLYLGLHLYYATLSNDVLPIVLWLPPRHESLPRTYRAWHLLSPYRLIFWERRPSLAALREAMRQNASAYVSSKPTIDDFMGIRGLARLVTDELRSIEKRARPWQNALALLLSREPDDRFEAYLLRLRPDSVQRQMLLQAMPPLTRMRAQSLFDPRRSPVTAQVGEDTFIADDRGWWHTTQGWARPRLVTDVAIHIERIVVGETPEETSYKGALIYRGQSVPFVTRDPLFRTDLFRWAREEALRRGLGAVRINPNWRRQAFNIALSFHHPTICKGVSRIGWNKEERFFQLPRGRLSMQGPQRNPDFDREIVLPARRIPLRSKLRPDEASLWSSTKWPPGLLCGVLQFLTNILAPLVGQSPSPLFAVTPVSAKAAYDLVRVFDGLQHTLPAGRIPRAHVAKFGVHDWPYWLAAANDTALNSWILSGGPAARQAVLSADLTTACLHVADGRGLFLLPAMSSPDKTLGHGIRGVVSAYLTDVARRGGRLTQNINSDFFRFLSTKGLYTERNLYNSLARYADVCRWLAVAKLSEQAYGDRHKKPPTETVNDVLVVRIPYSVVAKPAAKAALPPPAIRQITKVLQRLELLHAATDEAWLVLATAYRCADILTWKMGRLKYFPLTSKKRSS